MLYESTVERRQGCIYVNTVSVLNPVRSGSMNLDIRPKTECGHGRTGDPVSYLGMVLMWIIAICLRTEVYNWPHAVYTVDCNMKIPRVVE